MIRKSGYRFSEKIMLKQEIERDDESHLALGETTRFLSELNRLRALSRSAGDYRRLALILSSAAEPGHSAFSPSVLSGVSTVSRWACRSWASGSTYNSPVTIWPLAACFCRKAIAPTRSCG